MARLTFPVESNRRGEYGGESCYGPGKGVFVRCAVADHQCGRMRIGGSPVRAEPFEGEAVAGRACDDVVFGVVVWQFEQQVEAGRDTGDAHPGGMPAQGIDEPVAPPPVGEPGPADLPVVVAGGDELSEGELVEAAGAAVRESLDGDDVVDERRGVRASRAAGPEQGPYWRCRRRQRARGRVPGRRRRAGDRSGIRRRSRLR
jgi:hypothetical protein